MVKLIHVKLARCDVAASVFQAILCSAEVRKYTGQGSKNTTTIFDHAPAYSHAKHHESHHSNDTEIAHIATQQACCCCGTKFNKLAEMVENRKCPRATGRTRVETIVSCALPCTHHGLAQSKISLLLNTRSNHALEQDLATPLHCACLPTFTTSWAAVPASPFVSINTTGSVPLCPCGN